MSIGFSKNFNFERDTLARILQVLAEKPNTSRDELMTLVLVGSVEVAGLIGWIGKLGLRNNERRTLSALGRSVVKCDPYLENVGTMWLLHYQLSQNREAEVWFYLTNKFLPNKFKFTSQEALEYLQEAGIGQQSPKHLKNDVRIYLRAFAETQGLKRIQFLEKIGKNEYQKSLAIGIHPYLVAYVIYDQREKYYPTISTIRIGELLSADGNVGKVFLLDQEKLEEFLHQLRFEGLVDVSHTGGLDQVGFIYKDSVLSILEKYYQGSERSKL
jgi:hypothetical protein